MVLLAGTGDRSYLEVIRSLSWMLSEWLSFVLLPAHQLFLSDKMTKKNLYCYLPKILVFWAENVCKYTKSTKEKKGKEGIGKGKEKEKQG